MEEQELSMVLKVKPNHDLSKLANNIGEESLKRIGIEKITSGVKNDLKFYTITTLDKEKLIVEDLECVRYDFKFEKLRGNDREESSRMGKEVQSLLKMARIVLDMVPSS